MSTLPLPTRVLASGLLVLAVHACLLLALLTPAPLRLAPPPVVDVALLVAPGASTPPRAGLAMPARTAASVAPASASRSSGKVRLSPVPAATPLPVPAAASDLPAAVPDTLSVAAPVPPQVAVSAMASGLASASAAVAPASAGGGSGTAAGQGAGAAFTPPQPDPGNPSNPRPAYPAASRRLGETGVVALRLRVMPDGHVAEVQLLRSSGYDRLDQAALQVARRWTLRPARQGGEAVAAWLPYSIKFELEK